MTPGIFAALLIPPALVIVGIMVAIRNAIAEAAGAAQEIIRNNAETRRNYLKGS